MVIDTSAILAILQDGPERPRFNLAIEAASSRMMSVATWVETSIVIEVRYGAPGLAGLDLFIDRAAVEIVPVDMSSHGRAQAFSRFRKRTGGAQLRRLLPMRRHRAWRAAPHKGEDFQKTTLPLPFSRPEPPVSSGIPVSVSASPKLELKYSGE
jgi:ribonuclease VapC